MTIRANLMSDIQRTVLRTGGDGLVEQGPCHLVPEKFRQQRAAKKGKNGNGPGNSLDRKSGRLHRAEGNKDQKQARKGTRTGAAGGWGGGGQRSTREKCAMGG